MNHSKFTIDKQNYTLPNNYIGNRNYVVVILPAEALKKAWAEDQEKKGFYVPEDSALEHRANSDDPSVRENAEKGLIKKKFYKDKIKNGEPIEIPIINTGRYDPKTNSVLANGEIDFADGRHRTATLIEHGQAWIPAITHRELANSVTECCGGIILQSLETESIDKLLGAYKKTINMRPRL